MRPQPLGAVLSISVDLESAGSASGRSRETPQETVERLANCFEAAGQAVTWAASDPAGCATIRTVLETGPKHEVALLADPSWTLAAGSRSQLVAELVRRTTSARAEGIEVTTVALRDDALLVSSELLIKHGISAVRAATATGWRSAGQPATGPAALRYGLWQIRPTVRLPVGSSLSAWLLTIQLRRAIDRGIRRSTPLHLLIDAPAFSREASRSSWGALRSVLRHVERRQKVGALSVLTIRETIARLAAPRAGRGAQSILRAA